MVWEQGSVVIVNLCKLTENDVSRHRYWPEEGSALYHIYEVHLVSEHVWCEDYLVRSFYLKNLEVTIFYKRIERKYSPVKYPHFQVYVSSHNGKVAILVYFLWQKKCHLALS